MRHRLRDIVQHLAQRLARPVSAIWPASAVHGLCSGHSRPGWRLRDYRPRRSHVHRLPFTRSRGRTKAYVHPSAVLWARRDTVPAGPSMPRQADQTAWRGRGRPCARFRRSRWWETTSQHDRSDGRRRPWWRQIQAWSAKGLPCAQIEGTSWLQACMSSIDCRLGIVAEQLDRA